MKVLSEEKLKKMAEYIKSYMHENNGEVPKFREILEYMEMSKSVGYRYLMTLKERGIVEYNGKGTLGMNGGAFTAKSSSVRVPILGSVICGSPEEEEEHAEGYLAMPEEWAGKDCFLLRAYGDSMVDIGVEKGDLVLVRKSNSAENGQIVVALTEEGNTLKRIFWENGKPRLHAENKEYPPNKRDIYPKQIIIQGVAIKLIKDFK
jgi:repressor LexA